MRARKAWAEVFLRHVDVALRGEVSGYGEGGLGLDLGISVLFPTLMILKFCGHF